MRNRKHDIERYLRGELSPAEMHALEKEALNDPFLAEALEGIEHAGTENFLFDLHTLNNSVHYRTRARARKSKTVKMWGWTAGIAASVLLIAVSGFLVISLIRDQNSKNLAMKEETPLPKRKTDNDTVATTLDKPAETKVVPKPKAEDSNTSVSPAPAADVTKDNVVSGEEKAIIAEKQPNEEALNQQRIAEETSRKESQQADAEKSFESRQPEAIADIKDDADVEQKLKNRSAGVEVQPAPSSAQRSYRVDKFLSGRVRSADDGQALPGVNVIVKGTNTGTVTDAQGNFFLPLSDSRATIVFNFIGYESKELRIGDKREIDVALASDATELSEVVVTGYGVAKSSADPAPFRFAEPEGGRTQFKNYLSRSLKYPQQAIENEAEGRVTIRFIVKPDGTLTDFQVVKGIGFGCEEELIRLVKDGPAWKPSAKEDQPIADQVRLRFKFQLPKK